MNYALMNHQQRCVEFMAGREYGAVFMEPGLGKTLTEIDEVQNMSGVHIVVVICPKSIMAVWAEEVKKFGQDGYHGIWVWDNSKKINGFRLIQAGAVNWYIINVDAINPVAIKQKDPDGNVVYKKDAKGKEITRKGKPVPVTVVQDKTLSIVQDILDGNWDRAMVMVDESTIIKNPDSKRTKAVSQIGRMAKYRRILTGTPVANTPLDIYAQMTFLNPDIFPHSNSYFAFKNRYAIFGGYEDRQIVGYKNLDHLAEIVAKHSFQATKAECLDLPDRITQIRHVELSEGTWQMYRYLVDELIVEIADTEMTTDMVIKKMVKLRQLTGGWIKDDEGIIHHVGTEKINELKHLMDECQGQKVIIWCQFTHEIEALQELYPQAGVYHGGNVRKRDQVKLDFEHGDLPTIIIQNDTGSMGLTLNAASISIFYSNSNYPLVKNQSRDRNYRKGQDKCVTEYELLAEGSVDETIYNSIMNKTDLGQAILEARNNPDALRAALIPKYKKVNWKAPKRGLFDGIQTPGPKAVKPRPTQLGPDLGPRPE